jgi:hypothetical protein
MTNLIATADSWREIPPDCNGCQWSGPFPDGDVLWFLHPADVRQVCPVHGKDARFAEVGGQRVRLTNCDWVHWKPCGCLAGLTMARYAPTEDDAWKVFYNRKNARELAQARGERMELMTHKRCVAEVLPHWGKQCPHGKKP